MKKVGIGVLALLVLVVAAVTVVPMVIDWNGYKPDIAQAVKAATGRDLVIGGDIKVRVLPEIAFSFADVKLSDAEAINFSLMELFVLGLIVASLVHFCSRDAVQAGDIFAVFRYVLMFIMGLDSVPRLVQQMSRLRDIGMRMHRSSSCR